MLCLAPSKKKSTHTGSWAKEVEVMEPQIPRPDAPYPFKEAMFLPKVTQPRDQNGIPIQSVRLQTPLFFSLQPSVFLVLSSPHPMLESPLQMYIRSPLAHPYVRDGFVWQNKFPGIELNTTSHLTFSQWSCLDPWAHTTTTSLPPSPPPPKKNTPTLLPSPFDSLLILILYSHLCLL